MARLTFPRLVVFAAVSLSVLIVAPPALASPGDLDTSFGGDGIVTTAVNAISDGDAGVALAANGDVVIAGTDQNAARTSAQFVVAEYTPAGKLDHQFGGGDGIATATFAGCAFARGMALDAQGRIVVAGVRRDPCSSTSTRVAVARFQTDGTLDPSFGGGSGKEIFSLAGSAEGAEDVATDGNKIVVAGSVVPQHSTSVDFLLLRLNQDGHLDHTFSNDGFAFVSFGAGNSIPFAVTVQPDHRVVVCGATPFEQGVERFAVARLSSSGVLDTSFSSDGKATVGFGATENVCTSVAMDGGSILVGGFEGPETQGHCALARLTSAGHLDGSFGTNGRTTETLSSGADSVEGLAVGGSGKIDAAAVKNAPANGRFAVLRYLDDGTLDPSFGSGGIVTTKINSSAIPRAIAVGSGSILVSGTTFQQSGFRIVVARYHS